MYRDSSRKGLRIKFYGCYGSVDREGLRQLGFGHSDVRKNNWTTFVF